MAKAKGLTKQPYGLLTAQCLLPKARSD